MDVINGYTVIAMSETHIPADGRRERVIVGHNPDAPSPYVTTYIWWSPEGGYDRYWANGHFFERRSDAIAALVDLAF
jgi:hypothetical protein